MFLACFEPVVTRFGPWKIPKCFDNGPFWDQKWVKHGSKTNFPKSDLGPLGVHKQVKSAHLEPVLTEFSPFRHKGGISMAVMSWERKSAVLGGLLAEVGCMPIFSKSHINTTSGTTRCSGSTTNRATLQHIMLPMSTSKRAISNGN